MTAMMGMSSVHMAALLVTLVMSDTMNTSTMTMAQPGRASNTRSCSPIQAARPDFYTQANEILSVQVTKGQNFANIMLHAFI